MSAHTILLIIITIIALDFLLEQILDYINLKHQKSEVPDEMKGYYDEDKYCKSQKYLGVQTRFSFVTSAFSFVLALVMLVGGVFGMLDEWLRNTTLPSFLGGNDLSDPVVLALIFFGILYFASDILNMPFQVYHTFVIEEKFGFNKTTVKTFILDKLKGYFLTILIGGVILSVLFYLITRLGEGFWLYFWIVITVFLFFVNMFYTTLIVPLFNKLTPLESGELREAIENYSKQAKFSLRNIFVIDGSKRSSKSNAYFSGIGKKKKIIFFDTLINNHTTEELVAVLAHEVGHYKKKHIVTGFILSTIQVGIMLFILSFFVFNSTLSGALGAKEMGVHLNLLAFGLLYTPISKLTGLFMNLISRKNEFEADKYAAQTYNASALQDALKKLSVDNLSNLTPHPAYVFFHYSHPPLLKRLEALNLHL